jgi:hypothetical protein
MSAFERAPLSVVKTPVRNRRKSPVRLRLEPWGEEYTLPAGKTVQVLARGPEGDTLDIEWGSDAVTVYGWPGSVVAVLRNGIDIGAAPGETRFERLTAPFLPEGMRVREWIAEMTG